MKKHKKIHGRIYDALRGIFLLGKDEFHSLPGFLFQTFLFILIVLFAVFFIKPTYIETIIIILSLGLGVVIGSVNTIVEKLCDLYSLEYNIRIRDIKDMAAGACVLWFINFIVILIIMYLN